MARFNNRNMTGFIIQFEQADQHFGFADAQILLEPAGIQLDPSYGVVIINAPRGRRYVVRGFATEHARDRAKRDIPGIRFSIDLATGLGHRAHT